MPLLLRARVIDAVLKTQTAYGSPVTAQEVRAAQPTPLMRHTRALTELCHDITQLGPDEQGRSLHCAGRNRERLLLWWVQEPPVKRPAKKAARKKAQRPAAKKRAVKKRTPGKAAKKRARA